MQKHICYLHPFCRVLRAPSSVKFLRSARSVRITGTISTVHCIAQSTPPTIPMTFSETRKKGICAAADTTRRIQPVRHQSCPQYVCANFHVSIFFMERVVRYPTIPLIFPGECFHIILPQTIINIGTSRSHTNIKNQNHIEFILISYSFFFFFFGCGSSSYISATICRSNSPLSRMVTGSISFAP